MKTTTIFITAMVICFTAHFSTSAQTLLKKTIPNNPESCAVQGGTWHANPPGRGFFHGCEIKFPDADKSCQDGSQCQSGTCLVDEANCNGNINKYPKGNGYEKCHLKATCHNTTIPPYGCHLFLENGKILNRCLD